MLRPITALIALLSPSIAAADLSVRFVESAPKDRFVFANQSACETGRLAISIDLTGSAAGLVFDTQTGGAGVDVFQPFQVAVGADLLEATPLISDGDQALSFILEDLAPNQTFAFTIDVDDTLEQSELGQIRVSGAEIEGATLMVGDVRVAFDQGGTASLPLNCLS